MNERFPLALLSDSGRERIARAKLEAETAYEKRIAAMKMRLIGSRRYAARAAKVEERHAEEELKQAAREYLSAVLFAALKAFVNTKWKLQRILSAERKFFAELREEVFDTKWPGDRSGWNRNSVKKLFEDDVIAYIQTTEDWRQYKTQLDARGPKQPEQPRTPTIQVPVQAQEPQYWRAPTPLFYFESWDLKDLPNEARNQIKVKLLKIHADFLEGKMGEWPEIECWRRAYDIFAEEFKKNGLLSETVLTDGIPRMVADAGVSGRWAWGRVSSIGRTELFDKRLGSEWHPSWKVTGYFLKALSGRFTAWRSELLVQHGDRGHAAGKRKRGRPADSRNHERVSSMVEAKGAKETPDSHQLSENSDLTSQRCENEGDGTPIRSGRRTPDLQSSRERIKLVGILARELAIIKQETREYRTVDGLKRKYPNFILWKMIEDSQIKELVEGEPFTPKAYAGNLVLAKYGLTSRETLKKDRRKLRKST